MRTLVIPLFAPWLFAGSLAAQLSTPNDEGVAFGHVHLYVSSVEAHRALWSELLGVAIGERAGYTAVRVPGALIFLTEREPTLPSRATAVDHFALSVRDLDPVIARAQDRGVEVESHSAGPRPSARLSLPDGVTLELREDPAMPDDVRMDHVHLAARAPQELRTWYATLLGEAPGSDAAPVGVPGGELHFAASEDDRSRSHGTAIDHFGFEVADIEAFATHLRDHGIVFDTEPFYVESLDLWVAFFTDPSGARVEITEGLDRF